MLINAIVKLVKDVIMSQVNVFHVQKEHMEWDALKSVNARKTALLFVYKPRVNVFVIQIFMEIGKVKIYIEDLKKVRRRGGRESRTRVILHFLHPCVTSRRRRAYFIKRLSPQDGGKQ